MRILDRLRKKTLEEREPSLRAAQKHGEHTHKDSEDKKEYGKVTCIPTVLSSTKTVVPKAKQTKENDRELSLLELGEINWIEFGARLKQEQLLPPSYDRKPTKVNISLSKQNKPKVELVFNSKTSDSYRTIMICNDNEIYEYTNGAINQPTRLELKTTWNKFKEHVIYGINHNNKEEVNKIRKQGEELRDRAEKMMNIDMIFNDEQEFLKKHKNDTYEFFGYMYDDEKEIPFFVLPAKEQSENVHLAEMVTPFTPKTLEFCVSKLNDEEKYSNAEDEDSINCFIQKCKNIATKSIYQTDKWDKTINILVEMLKKHAEEYRNKNPEL